MPPASIARHAWVECGHIAQRDGKAFRGACRDIAWD